MFTNYSEFIKQAELQTGNLSFYYQDEEIKQNRLFNTIQKELDNIIYYISCGETEHIYKSHGLYKIVLKYCAYDSQNITIEDIRIKFNILGINPTSIKGYINEENITFVCLFNI